MTKLKNIMFFTKCIYEASVLCGSLTVWISQETYKGFYLGGGKGFIFKSETIAFMAVILIFQMIAGRIE